ncbi:MAG TPA: ABC transporter substrate-binding protein [Acidimicrobiales bacterium]|nr:ABC transporter substrate-binding protein [Acidimicrobiales bacterium]
MQNALRSRWWRLASIVAITGLLTAACAEDDDDGGETGGSSEDAKTSLTIAGPETGSEADGFTEAFEAFTEETGIEISYTGSRDFETQIRVSAEGGDLPDIAVIPQPGLVKDLADKITPVSDEILKAHEEEFNEYLWELVTVDDEVLGIPNKADVKSLVWYSPKTFEAKGYEVPETWDDMLALQDEMKGDGIAPWCIGIESGDATGWTLTDWMEDIMLRMHGPEVYDQWVAHEIPFNDPKVAEAAAEVEKIWFGSGNVLNGRQSIASTGFQQAGLPVADGTCGMHRQANFYGAQFKEKGGLTFGEDGDVNVFYLPTMSDEFGKVLLSGGTYVVAFNDNEATMKAMEFLASPAYADGRNEAGKGGFLSPNKEHDTSKYADDLDRTLADLLVSSETVRFDGSDNMPSEVGAGAFWKEGTNWVLGTSNAKTFLDNVENAWPD